jgi:lipoprotein-anchoring transpeptidase ErfK/SrfK
MDVAGKPRRAKTASRHWPDGLIGSARPREKWHGQIRGMRELGSRGLDVRLDSIRQAGIRRQAMIATSLAVLVLVASPAQARWFFEPEPATKSRALPPAQQGAAEPNAQRKGAKKAGKKGAKTTAVAKAPEKMPAGPLSIVVSIKQQRLTVYANGQPFAHSPVSTGVPGHPTPQGVFSVIQKNLHHRSNIYSDAPMPYMQRITWSGVAMHEGKLPGYPASHGCIRLPREFAQRLWGMTRIGARVIIAQDEVAPADITHTRLAALNFPTLSAAEEPVSRVRLATAAPSGVVDAPLKGTIDESTARATATSAAPTVEAERAAPRVPDKGAIATSAKDPLLKPGPISIFISRKTGKLYVRKGLEEVLEVPVTIAQPDQPIGTHLFTALKADGENMRWNVVSLPIQRLVKNGKYLMTMNRGEKLRKELTAPVHETLPPGDPHAALDRITIPDAIVARITEMMSPGASLMVSDLGLSHETGKGTDFIILTR